MGMRERSSIERKRARQEYGPTREAWAVLDRGEIIMYFDDSEDPPEVDLLFRHNNKFIRYRLHNYTLAELECFEEIIKRAIKRAKPICRELDKRARQAWEEGDDSHARSYRPVPQVLVRPGFLGEHDKGVPKRPDEPAGEHPRGGAAKP